MTDMVTLVKIALMITIMVTLVWMMTTYFDRKPEYADGGIASVPSLALPLLEDVFPLPAEPPSLEPEPEPFPFCVDCPLLLGGGESVSVGSAPAALGALLSLLPGAEMAPDVGLLSGTEALSDAALLANAAMLGTTELLAGDIEAAEGAEIAGVGVFTADGELADDAGLLTEATLPEDRDELTEDPGVTDDAELESDDELRDEVELSAGAEVVGEPGGLLLVEPSATTVGVVELGEEFVLGEVLVELDEGGATASTVGETVLDGVDEGVGEDEEGTLELEGTAGVLELENEVTLKVRLDEGLELEGLVVGGIATGGVEMLGGPVDVLFVVASVPLGKRTVGDGGSDTVLFEAAVEFEVFDAGEAGKINSPENELIVSRALNPLTPKNEGEAAEVHVQLTPGSQDGSPEQHPGGGEPPLLKVKAVQPG